jgi:methylmalonyl-CoA/ethylmalonyl-CoA epimerase
MIRGVDHLGIAVRSIAEGRVFYEALGLHVEEIEEVPGDQVRVAMIPCGETRIELLEPTSPESPIARFLERRGPGIHHICLASDALAADDGQLRAAGYQVLRPQPTRGAGGCWIQFVHPKSTGGVLIELSQPGDDDGHGGGHGGDSGGHGHGGGAEPR